MLVRWTPDAAEDLEQIATYIAQDNLAAAERVVNTIVESTEGLAQNPLRGRMGRIHGTRELVLAPLPYLVLYRVSHDVIVVLNIVHGARRWPPNIER